MLECTETAPSATPDCGGCGAREGAPHAETCEHRRRVHLIDPKPAGQYVATECVMCGFMLIPPFGGKGALVFTTEKQWNSSPYNCCKIPPKKGKGYSICQS